MESLEALEEEGYITAEEAVGIAEEITYARIPYVEKLIRCGSSLLEQAKFVNVQESKTMIKDAIYKLDEALSIDPKNAEALWYLGKANCTYAFLTADQEEANVIFVKAIEYAQKAVDEDPENELYMDSLIVVARAPEFHFAVHRQIFAQPDMMDPVPSTSSSAEVAPKYRCAVHRQIFAQPDMMDPLPSTSSSAGVAPEFRFTVHGQISAQPVMMDPVLLTSSSAEVESSKPKPKTEKTFGWFARGFVIVALAGFAISQVTRPRPMRSEEFRRRG